MTGKRINMWFHQTRDYVEVERLSGGGWIVCRHICVWQPPMDVFENEDGLVVRVEVAGMQAEDFSIALEGRTLIVAGTRVDSAPKRTYHQMEIRFGEFRAEVLVPWPAESEDVEAVYENGFLEVHLPRPAAKRVPVVAAEAEED